jgi:hypothetical protein
MNNKNDEARMTNDEGMTKLEIRIGAGHSSLVIPSSFGIRH